MVGIRRKKFYFTLRWEDRLLAEDKAHRAAIQKKCDDKRKDKKAKENKKYYLRRKAKKIAKERAEAGEEVAEYNFDAVDSCSNDSRASHSDALTKTDGTQESYESDGTCYEPRPKKSKLELRVETGSDLPNLDIVNSQSSPHGSFDGNKDEDVCMLPILNNHSERSYAPSNGDPGQTFFNQMNNFAAPFISIKTLNLTIPNVSTTTTRINHSKISRSKISQEPKMTSKVSGKAFSSSHVSNRVSKHVYDGPSDQENRYKNVTIRRPRKPPPRRQSPSTNEESQEEDGDSDASLKSNDSNSGYSGDISEEEEGNQEACASNSLGNQVNYITSMNRKTDNRSSIKQIDNSMPYLNQKRSSHAQSRQEHFSKMLLQTTRDNIRL